MAGFGMVALFYFHIDLEARKAKTAGQLGEDGQGGASLARGGAGRKGHWEAQQGAELNYLSFAQDVPFSNRWPRLAGSFFFPSDTAG